MYQGLGTGPLYSGTTPKASKATAASRSRSSKLNLAMAVAEVSEDRILFASPGSEAELAINPVASVESVVRDVSSNLWSAMRQVEDRQKTYRYSGFTRLNKCRCNNRHWPANNDRSCQQLKRQQAPASPATRRRVTDEYRLLLSSAITGVASTSSPPGLVRTWLPEVN